MVSTTRAASLFDTADISQAEHRAGRTREKLKRLDLYAELRSAVLPFCRLKRGQIWEDPMRGHRVAVLDASHAEDVAQIIGGETVRLALNDPPYNVTVGNANTDALFQVSLSEYLDFSQKWIRNTIACLKDDAHFYVWMGADYRNGFQPLPDIILMMREFHELTPRNFITLRNQRGYGTQKNWMWVRQELLYYVKGAPSFNVGAEYTDVPRILKGYYKVVGGRMTENTERNNSQFIRAGNVWMDIQQVFYRMEENVPGCYAQKPLKAIERLINSATEENDTVLDCFAHSGTTLVAGERVNRRVITFDVDPIFAEISIRRLERFRKLGKSGWQWQNPFPEMEGAEEHRWI